MDVGVVYAYVEAFSGDLAGCDDLDLLPGELAEKSPKDRGYAADSAGMAMRRRQIQVHKRNPNQVLLYAVASLKKSYYCEHGEPRISCTKRHVGE